jgi:hypothetical protein
MRWCTIVAMSFVGLLTVISSAFVPAAHAAVNHNETFR